MFKVLSVLLVIGKVRSEYDENLDARRDESSSSDYEDTVDGLFWNNYQWSNTENSGQKNSNLNTVSEGEDEIDGFFTKNKTTPEEKEQRRREREEGEREKAEKKARELQEEKERLISLMWKAPIYQGRDPNKPFTDAEIARFRRVVKFAAGFN